MSDEDRKIGELIEGWAPMHNSQRTFHYYRQKSPDERLIRALCGKWGLTPDMVEALGPLQPYQPGALHIGPQDCAACSRKLRANERRAR